jgi:hypothetical protein
MPCFDQSSETEKYAELKKRWTHNSDVADLLCKTMKIVEKSFPRVAGSLPMDVIEWWTEHKKRDARRHAAEEEQKDIELRRRKALEKLTPADKEVLNLDTELRRRDVDGNSLLRKRSKRK